MNARIKRLQFHIPLRVWLLLVLTAVTGLFLLFAIWQWSSDRTEIDEALQAYDKVRAVAAYRLPPEGDQSSDLPETIFLPDAPDAVVAADLQARIRQMASAHGVDLMRADGLPLKEEGGLKMTGARVEMNGTLTGIYGVLHDIDTSMPVLATPRAALRNINGSAGDAQADTRLVLDIDIVGFLKLRAAEPAKASP